MTTLREFYRAFRSHGYKASVALKSARRSMESPETRAYVRVQSPGVGPAFGADKARWIERPAFAGLRFVGFADEVGIRSGYRKRSLDHFGWYTDDDCYQTYRAAVYQLPGRNGMARYVPAYREQENRKDTNGESALFFFDDIIEHKTTDSYDTSGALECAYRADHFAEIYAERQCDYERAWQAGISVALTRNEELPNNARAILDEIKIVRKYDSLPNPLPELRDRVLGQLRKLLDERETLRASIDKTLSEYRNGADNVAFRDGLQSY